MFTQSLIQRAATEQQVNPLLATTTSLSGTLVGVPAT